MKKFMPISKEALAKLPEDIQNEVRDSLHCFNEINVWFENGKHHASIGRCIRSFYSADHKFIGVAYRNDIYTPEEIRVMDEENNKYACPY